uniref:Zinc finger ZPR1-type domain-containing protein n=1 Tax=Strongyloides stercoralis TaxID=6248 RepID=A0A0K0EIE7_STRER
MSSDNDVVFKDLSADNEDQAPLEIESFCFNCHKNGVTKLMCTRIPFYKQVIVMSFRCEHCGFSNNEIQSGEKVQEFGTEIVLKVQNERDLNRQLVKSEFAQIEIPELNLEIPPKSQPGEITTVEGILSRVKEGLEQNQAQRKLEHPDDAKKIDEFIEKLENLRQLKSNWTLKLKDVSGNCYIQNPDPLHVDPHCITSHYYRNLADRKILGFADDDDEEDDISKDPDTQWKSFEDVKQEVLHFPSKCPNCNKMIETLMKPTDIPYFQTVIIMSTKCDACGYKSNEVKSCGSFQDYGCKLSLKVRNEIDLARDVLKSDTCSLQIPELDLEVGMGALCGRFTTIEGLITATKEQIEEQGRFFVGDSAVNDDKGKFQNLLQKFDDIIALKLPITVILDDPAGNSYIQSVTAPLDDPQLEKTFYTRSYEQNDELGLNDMKTENYENNTNEKMDVIVEEEEET